MKRFLDRLILLGTAFTALAPAVRLLLIALAVGTVYFAASDFKTKDSLGTYIENYNNYRREKDSVVQFVKDSVTEVVKIHKKTSDSAMKEANKARSTVQMLQATRPSKDSALKLQNEIDSLTRVIVDSVELARVVIPKQDLLIKKLDSTNTWHESINSALKIENSNLRIAHTNDSLTIKKQDGGIAKLNEQLAKLPEAPKKDKFLGFIPQPSRKVSFGVGTVVGAVSMIVVSSAVK